ncbi:MAG: NADH-quinone oxidoreductase subunit L [Candidatus Micrarchaeia archaeon]
MFALLVVVPMLVAAILALPLKDHFEIVRYLSLFASLASLIMAFALGMEGAHVESINWFSISNYSFHIVAYTYPLNMLLLYLIAVITPLIIAYSIGFMDTPSEQARYYFELLMFASAMMLFALAGNFLTMFIGWEMLGITSYLLIGFWYRKRAPAHAARKAITTVFIGDILMLAAMIMLWVAYGTFSFAYIMQASSGAYAYIALVLVLAAAYTKSAQFPFHEWLPDAMEGPTPVSAFLHSSTMVKAGVFLVAVLLPLYMRFGMGWIIIMLGIITSIIAISNALTETHIKRILAYSTVEDMGLMFVALGFGSLIGAMLLFVVQAFYKALLFMNAGTIMKANNEEENIYRSYSPKSYKPLFITMLIGVLSLAGIFPVSGFFGRVGVEVAASNIYVYVVLLLIDFASSVYIFRWLYVPMRKPKSAYEESEVSMNFGRTPKSMLVPQYILGAIVLAAGILYFYMPKFLSGYIGSQMRIAIADSLIESTVVVLGIFVAYVLFSKHRAEKGIEAMHTTLYKIAYNSLATNKFYQYFADIFIYMSKAFETFDYALLGFVKTGGRGIVLFGNFVRKAETGQINIYAIAFVLGFLLLIFMVILK